MYTFFLSHCGIGLLLNSEADPVVSWHVSRWWQADATYAAMALKVSNCLLIDRKYCWFPHFCI